MLGYPKSTVYDVYKRWNEDNVDVRKAHESRADKKRTPRFLAGLSRSIDTSPGTPMSVLAKKRDVSRRTIGRAVKDDLELKSYKLYKRHVLTDRMKTTRKANATKIINDMKSHGGRIIFFSDEKNWTVDRTRNVQNDRFLASERGDVPHVYTTKFPAAVMTLGVIGSNGSVMPPHFFEPKKRVGAKEYADVLESKVIPWMQAEAAGRPFIFQQDSAPAHTAALTTSVLNANNVSFWPAQTWPSNSPDMNPMDFFF